VQEFFHSLIQILNNLS